VPVLLYITKPPACLDYTGVLKENKKNFKLNFHRRLLALLFNCEFLLECTLLKHSDYITTLSQKQWIISTVNNEM
jgi:hypothetical protein